MATKSILKNVTIKGKKNCAMLASALENASKADCGCCCNGGK